MAIDFMVLPLSRYISGDFITPAMEFAWSIGLPYSVFSPEGRRDHPQGVAFGGPDARARRTEIVPMLMDDLRQLPAPIPTALWDEQTDVDPVFHRVDPASYEALTTEARSRTARGPIASFFRLASRPPAHLTATLFLPCAFDPPFAMSSPFDRVTGSIERARAELADTGWGSASASARETLAEALDDAARLRLPMIIDW